MLTSESNFEIELRAKTKVVSLRVRLKGALWRSPVSKAHRVSGSIRARFRTLILGVSVTLLQALGNGQPQQQNVEVQYSLLIRLRKLWLRFRGKHRHDHPQGSLVVKPAENPTPAKKKWRRSLSSVGKQLLLRSKSSKKITMQVMSLEIFGLGCKSFPYGRGYCFHRFKNLTFVGGDFGEITGELWGALQEPVKENGYVAHYLDALRTDRVARVLHGVGMVSTLIVLVQLAGTRGLPLLVTFVTGLAIVGRLVFVNRHAFLDSGVQQLWCEVMSVGGISLLPQVLRAVFLPYLPQVGVIASESILGTLTLILILLALYQGLPFKTMRLFGIVSAGIPAILVLWAPMLQLWTCCWSPANVNFMQVFTGLLAVLINCLLGYPQHSLNQQQTLQCLRRQ